MRRVLALALVLLPVTARAQRLWQDAENTNGYVSTVTPPAGACFLYQTAAFDIQCYTSVPAGFISGVPTGVLEGVAGAITGYSATANQVQVGAASGGGLLGRTSLTFDGTNLGIGAPSSGVQTALRGFASAGATQLTLYPSGGTTVAPIYNVIPRGAATGSSVFLYNTDAIADGTNYERLDIIANGTSGYIIASQRAGTGTVRQIAIGADSTSPQELILDPSGSTSFNAGDVLFGRSGNQALTKTGGSLSILTADANSLLLRTNNTTRVTISSTGLITLPGFAGGGNQCAYFDNTGLLSVTGSACGTGSGAGGITQLTGDVTAGPGSGSQAATLVNLPNDVSQAGDLLATSIAAPATPSVGKARVYIDSTSKNIAAKNDAGTVNHGSQTIASTTGLALTGLSDAGAWTTQSFQAPLAACTDYVSVSCQTGATDIGGSNATATVTGVESAATMRGWVEWKAVTAPANPTGTSVREFDSLFGQGLTSVDSSGVFRYMVPDKTCSASQWVSQSAGGTLTCTQPAFSSLSGTATCSQVAGTTTLFDGGSCAGTAWSTSGTFTNGQALVTSAGHITATNECNVMATCAASGDLSGSYPGPNVVAMHDGGSVRHPTSGTWSTSSYLGTDSSGNIVTQATPTKLTYSLQLMLGSNTPNTWLLEGGAGLWSNGAFIEYPNDFKATRIQVIWYLTSNIVLAGTLSAFATRNGSGIGGTGFSVTSATSTGVHVGTNLPTSSTSPSDTYGLAFTTDSLYSAASPSAVFVTVEVLLLP